MNWPQMYWLNTFYCQQSLSVSCHVPVTFGSPATQAHCDWLKTVPPGQFLVKLPDSVTWRYFVSSLLIARMSHVTVSVADSAIMQ